MTNPNTFQSYHFCQQPTMFLSHKNNTKPIELVSVCMFSPPVCDDESRDVLQSSYNLTSTLASIIHCHSATPREPLVLQVRTELSILPDNQTEIPLVHSLTLMPYVCLEVRSDSYLLKHAQNHVNTCMSSASMHASRACIFILCACFT